MSKEYSFELNNSRVDLDTGKIKSNMKIVELFADMAAGKELGAKYGKKADEGVAYIKDLGTKSLNGDFSSISELNSLRRLVIEPLLLDEIKLLSLFGTYKPLGYGETIEREIYSHEGEKARFQAANGDVTFPGIVSETYTVPSQVISGGYVIDYRAIAMGSLERENEGMQLVRTTIRNKAALYIVKKLYQAIKTASGVKYWAEASGIAKATLDSNLKKVRRWGKPTILGDYSVVSQISAMVGFTDGTSYNITGVSEAAMEEIRKNGLLGTYIGSPITEIPNQYDVTQKTSDGTNFKTLLPEGLLFLLPAGMDSPVMTWTRGGLTSLTGVDVAKGVQMTRFDLEVAADIAKGQEYKVGLINDSALSAATEFTL
jgi:hypothetical protein